MKSKLNIITYINLDYLNNEIEKFKNNNQERSFVELTTNQFQLSGLSYDDKVKSITNIAPNVLDGSLDIIDAIIPNNPLLAHEIIQNLFVLNKLELMIAKSEDDIKRYEDFTSNESKKASM